MIWHHCPMEINKKKDYNNDRSNNNDSFVTLVLFGIFFMLFYVYHYNRE